MRSLSKVDIVLANQMYIAKKDLPPGLLTRLVRIAAFQNPEFYSAQAMRFSTFGKPRIISCAQDFQEHIGLPRGCTEEATEVLSSLGIRLQVDDKRETGTEAGCCFRGKLDVRQEEAVSKLLRHEIGILAAPTAFGKTVVAAHMIAERGRNTLGRVLMTPALTPCFSQCQSPGGERWHSMRGDFIGCMTKRRR